MATTLKYRDLYGREALVSDLTLALMQADDNRHIRLRDKSREALSQAYWQDSYDKLLALTITR